MRTRLVSCLPVVVGIVACVVACVGDDPLSSATGPGDDAGGGTDSATGTDSTSDGAAADTSTTEDSGGEGGTFSPASLAGDLALWLVAGKGVTEANGVASWLDQSPQPLTLLPLSLDRKPALEKGVLGGQDVINFSLKNMAMTVAHSPKLAFGSGDDFLIASVMSQTTTTAFPGFVWFKASTLQNGYEDGAMFGASLQFDDNTGFRMDKDPADVLSSTGIPLADHGYHVIIGRRIGSTTIQVRTDGVVKNKIVNAFDVSLPANDLAVGNIAPPGATFNPSFAFRVAEVIAVHRGGGLSITDVEVANLEAYLKKKYTTP